MYNKCQKRAKIPTKIFHFDHFLPTLRKKVRAKRLRNEEKGVPLQADYYRGASLWDFYLRVNSSFHWPGRVVSESQEDGLRGRHSPPIIMLKNN